MHYLTLGKTGLKVSEVGFGGIPIVRLNHEEAIKVLRYAYEKGITFYDTANMYGDSEEKMGLAFSGMRDKIILATKTIKRDKEGSQKDLENSLNKLQTDYLDLFQLHQISSEEQWEKASNGVMEVVRKAKEEGKIRHLGVTSHSLEMAIRLAKTGLFTTVQFPFNFIEDALKDNLKLLIDELSLGVIAMKPFGGGMIDNAPIAFKFLRQFPQAIPIPGFDSTQSVDEIVAIYEKPNEITQADISLMEQTKKDVGKEFCRRCEYCQPCPQGVMITPAMLYKVTTLRMSPQNAIPFMGKALETVKDCVDCGECVERCPYNLPIPRILKQHYQLYEKDRDSLK